MAIAILVPPAFAGLDPVNGMPGFWIDAATPGGWQATGDPDFGVDLQAIDANTVDAFNDGSGFSGTSSAVYFEDVGDIPPTATILSVQLVVNFDVVGIGMQDANSPFNIQQGAIPTVSLIGADADDFTGAGTFLSVVMTANPATAAPWTYDDLYGQPLPFSDPHGFQGWWGLSVFGGSTSPVGTQQYLLNYVALEVVFDDAGPVTPTNWTMDAAFVTGGKGTREFGARRIT